MKKLDEKTRELMEDKIFDYILESWSEGILSNSRQITKDLSRMSDKELKKMYKDYFEE